MLILGALNTVALNTLALDVAYVPSVGRTGPDPEPGWASIRSLGPGVPSIASLGPEPRRANIRSSGPDPTKITIS